MSVNSDSIKAFRDIFYNLKMNGKVRSPRNLKTLEVENFSFTLPPYVRFMNFKCRKLNINYIKQEFMWYLKGDRFDRSIGQHAKLWNELVNKDGSINSNYGQYIFGQQNQFDRVIKTLIDDKDSRRANIIILSNEHFNQETKDIPCTYSLNFRISENKLNMTVGMRSQDAVFGLGNDIPCFSFIHEMMWNALMIKYPSLSYGDYYHSVDSFHIYERHFNLLDLIESDEYEEVRCPIIKGPREVNFLRKYNFNNIPDLFEFSNWLKSTC